MTELLPLLFSRLSQGVALFDRVPFLQPWTAASLGSCCPRAAVLAWIQQCLHLAALLHSEIPPCWFVRAAIYDKLCAEASHSLACS